MLESKLFRSIHSHLNHITWLQSHHVISQFCFCIAVCDNIIMRFIIYIFNKTISYFWNRFLMINRSIILHEVDTKRKFFFAHLRRIETIDDVMKRKSIIKWKKLISKSFSIVLVKYKEDLIYRMLRFNEIIYRVSFVIWIKKKREESFFVEIANETSTKKSITKLIEFLTKKQTLKSNSIIIFMFSFQFN
jgi:hypothetical protein